MSDAKNDREFRSFESYKDQFFERRHRERKCTPSDPIAAGASLAKESLKMIADLLVDESDSAEVDKNSEIE
jgi:hypothetical protein